jgi:ABC-2 type transport system ATP-binding protein
MVAVDRVTKSFPWKRSLPQILTGRNRGRRLVLDDISLTIAPGELMGLLGPNGAGKTTLCQLIATLAYPDRGSITIAGMSERADAAKIRRLIGYCSSAERGFYYRLTARENLRFFGTLADVPARALERRIDEVLELVDLRDGAGTQYERFSTGMRQRLSFARALLNDPQLVLLDEPTKAVDPVHAQQIRTFVRRTLVDEMGKTVILSTNMLDEAWSLCDRVAVLRDGKFAAIESPSNLSALHGSSRLYQLEVEGIGDEILVRARGLEASARVSAVAHGDAVRIDVELEPDAQALTELLRTFSTDGMRIRSVGLRDTDPAKIFAYLTGFEL